MTGIDFDLFFKLSIFLIVWIVIFLICREIVCWYFKINMRVKLMKEIRDLLQGDCSSEINNNRKDMETHKKRGTDNPLRSEFSSMSEKEFKDRIFETYNSGDLKQCKALLEGLIREIPNSKYIDFIGHDKLKEINKKLGISE